ncbi:TetR/AcrR family transcriptional regulator [Rothia nasimurium]|uniref:TetR/AcrR family transcriptional regulator n=1 Tax=Rothia nasimurium TaxID=85336 RepID=UPI003B9E5A14
MALTREKILETALEVLHSFGLADLSMRRLATELGVAPGALYYHVKNKQELLGSLASRMLSTVPVEPATSSREEAGRAVPALLGACEELYRQLIPIKESSEVVRLALALTPPADSQTPLPLIPVFTSHFTYITNQQYAPLAAESLLHLALSLLEQEQTRALLTGSVPPAEPPASYRQALTALITGYTHLTDQ